MVKPQLFIILSLVIVALVVANNDKAGVKVAITQDAVIEFERKFLPLALQKLGTIHVPDQDINVDIKIGTLHIHLSEIAINISRLLAQNINVQFVAPNLVNIQANDCAGNGGFKAYYKVLFYSETDRVNINVKWVNISGQVSLGTTPSRQVPGKLLPSAHINALNLDLDFDIDIHGSLIADVINLIKPIIKSKIKSIIKEVAQKEIVAKSTDIINDIVNKLPVYVPLPGKFSLAVDYSLLSAPKVENGFLIVNSNGAIVDLRHPESMNPPFTIPDNIPSYDQQGKKIQAFVSDYSINTAANSLYLAGVLNIEILPSDIPDQLPFKLNTTTINTLLPGISDKYGKDKPVYILCKATGAPLASVNSTVLNAKLYENCRINVEINPGQQETAYVFKTDIEASGKVTLKDQTVSGQVLSVKLTNSEQIESKLDKADITVVEMMFNFAAQMGLPYLNEKFLKEIKIDIPTVEGINFNDSSLEHHDRYIEVNLTPTFVGNWADVLLKSLEPKEDDAKNALDFPEESF